MTSPFRARPRRRSLLSLLLAALLFTAPTHACAQTRPGLVSFQRLAIPDDIPAHLTTAMAQDQHGLLWFGTQDGLVRFDGYSYKVYRARPGDDHALGGSYVRALLVARDGRLWVGTASGGVSVFDPRTERFTQYRHSQDGAGLSHDRVEGIAEDRDGMMWLATFDGVDRLDPATGKVTHFRHDALDAGSLASNEVRSVLADREGRLWVGSHDGLQLWQDGRWLRVASTPGAQGSLAGQHVVRLFQDSQGRIWIGTDSDGAAMLDPARLPEVADAVQPPAADLLVRWQPADKRDPLQLDPSKLSYRWVYSFAQTASGEIWVATFGNGIDVIDPKTLKVVDRLRHDAGNTNSIGAGRIGALLADRAGSMWAGSWGGGVARHDPQSRAFLKIRHSAINPDTPAHPGVVRAMQTSDGKLWLGTNGEGVDVLDQDGHVVARHRPRRNDPAALADGAVTCLAQDAGGGMWVATLDGTLHRLRAGAKGFERYSEAQGLPGGPIRAMVFGPDGALWAGSSKGLARMTLGAAADGKITAYRHVAEDPATLSGREVESLAFTPDGTLWAGTENGVNAFNPQTGTAVRIRRDPQRSDSLPDNWVPDLMVDRHGKLWLATQSGVALLASWDGKQAHFDVLARRTALAPQPAESLIEDAQGMVWLNGRTRIDPATWTFHTFGPADGADFRTRYIASRAMTRQGDLLFGTPEGLLVVRPALLDPRHAAVPVVATSLSVAGKPVPGGAELASLVLTPAQRGLRLEFASPDYRAADHVRYRYQLDGYDADWVEVDARQRVAAYTGLPPGEYRLRVQASGADGWQPGEWKLGVTVQPAFYQTVHFRVLMWLLGAATVFGLFRLRLRQLRRRAERLELMVAERTAALETAYRDIEQASLTDPLTGLRNRRFLEQAFQADLDLVARRHANGSPPPDSDLLLFMLDLDHFKSVNDRYGHAAGDAVLVQAAGVLRQCMRGSDHIVRWGGEEFLLLARLVDRSQGPAMAEKIRAAIANHPFVLPDGTVLHKTVSIGYAACPAVPGQMGGMNLDSLQQLADTALYAAKRSWRDAWVGVSLETMGREGAVRRFLADPAANASEWHVESSRSDGMQWG
ncbi:ligand-binding sensor domain-containing diguanylate cyclase [Pseudoduganella ginsengisoli]|nr:ligand-binding sensor domain-containing diguanylate cyclase [Pseudoduganella ginsengisoli]